MLNLPNMHCMHCIERAVFSVHKSPQDRVCLVSCEMWRFILGVWITLFETLNRNRSELGGRRRCVEGGWRWKRFCCLSIYITWQEAVLPGHVISRSKTLLSELFQLLPITWRWLFTFWLGVGHEIFDVRSPDVILGLYEKRVHICNRRSKENASVFSKFQYWYYLVYGFGS